MTCRIALHVVLCSAMKSNHPLVIHMGTAAGVPLSCCWFASVDSFHDQNCFAVSSYRLPPPPHPDVSPTLSYCWLTEPPVSPWGWRPTSPRTTWRRSSTPLLLLLKTRTCPTSSCFGWYPLQTFPLEVRRLLYTTDAEWGWGEGGGEGGGGGTVVTQEVNRCSAQVAST